MPETNPHSTSTDSKSASHDAGGAAIPHAEALPAHLAEAYVEEIVRRFEPQLQKIQAQLADLIEGQYAASSKSFEPLLTVEEVAEWLSVCIRTVETLVSEDELVPIYVRSARRFSVKDVQAYLRRQAGHKKQQTRQRA